MRAYLFAVSGTVIIAAIVTAIAPEGKISGVIRTAVKLMCLIVIAEPIAKYFVSVFLFFISLSVYLTIARYFSPIFTGL